MRTLGIIVVSAFVLAACSSPGSPSTGSQASAATSAPAATSGIEGTPAPGSKFAEIHLGMDKTQIQSMIGQPTDQSSHETGKAFIPFYFGSDTTEINAHYKGEGVLTYASRAVGDNSYVLTGITVNTSDPGYIQ